MALGSTNMTVFKGSKTVGTLRGPKGPMRTTERTPSPTVTYAPDGAAPAMPAVPAQQSISKLSMRQQLDKNPEISALQGEYHCRGNFESNLEYGFESP